MHLEVLVHRVICVMLSLMTLTCLGCGRSTAPIVANDAKEDVVTSKRQMDPM